MHYTCKYISPIGNMLLAADDCGLIGAWFEDQKHFAVHLDARSSEKDMPVFQSAVNWLDIYFSGQKPQFDVKIHFIGTEFQHRVWNILLKIPYGKTVTYSDIAKELVSDYEYVNMSAQAVGGAVGRNPISVIVPCHRVIGKNGDMTGYAGGIEKKISLLKIEKIL